MSERFQTKSFTIGRADVSQKDVAFEIVDEYCETVGVVVRDDATEFEKYFNDNAGIWLAVSDSDQEVVGCIALRPLPHLCKTQFAFTIEPDTKTARDTTTIRRLLSLCGAHCPPSHSSEMCVRTASLHHPNSLGTAEIDSSSPLFLPRLEFYDFYPKSKNTIE